MRRGLGQNESNHDREIAKQIILHQSRAILRQSRAILRRDHIAIRESICVSSTRAGFSSAQFRMRAACVVYINGDHHMIRRMAMTLQFVTLAALAVSVPAWVAPALAQTWPAKPVRIVNTFAA